MAEDRRDGSKNGQEDQRDQELEEQARRHLEEQTGKVTEEDLKGLLAKADDLLKVVERARLLRKSMGKVRLLLRMLSDNFEGTYTEVPWRIIAAIVVALVYILNPVDAIPDYIPVIGFMDDAAVLAIAWSLVESDVREYARWKYPRATEEVRRLIRFLFPEVVPE